MAWPSRIERRKVRHCGVDRPLRAQNSRITFEFLGEYFLTGAGRGEGRCFGRPEGLRWAARTSASAGEAARFGSGATRGTVEGGALEAGGAVAGRFGASAAVPVSARPAPPVAAGLRGSELSCRCSGPGLFWPTQLAAPNAAATSRTAAPPPRIRRSACGLMPPLGAAGAACCEERCFATAGGAAASGVALRAPHRCLSSR